VAPRSLKLAGRDAVIVSTAKKAQLALRDGEPLWVITAMGSKPKL
jgi:hypothetical protein